MPLFEYGFEAVAFCLVRILPLIFKIYKESKCVCNKLLGLFPRGPVAVVLALKPEQKIFEVLGFCGVVKVK